MYYVRCGPNKSNMGDLIGPYLYAKLNNGQEIGTPATSSMPVFFTCGSILQPQLIGPNAVVWGSGIIARRGSFARKPKLVTAVRGPLSRKALIASGIPCPEIYGDPGLLLPLFYPKDPQAKPKFRVGIVPHYVDYTHMKKAFENNPNVCVVQMDYVDPKNPTIAGTVEGVCRELLQCECTISSSLHGLILSHAYGIPGAWMTTKNQLFGDGIKYLDYYASIGFSEAKPMHPIPWTSVVADKNNIEALILSYAGAKPKAMPDLNKLLEACPFGKK